MYGRVFQALGPCLLLVLSFQASAQMDSSSAVLLRSSGKAANPKKLDGTRYKMRAPESHKDEDEDEEPGTYIPSPVPKTNTNAKVSTSTPVKSEAPTPVIAPVPSSATASASASASDSVPEHPPVTVQVRELILGGSDGDIDEAKKQIHPEDPRANILNISFAPAYFYDGSSSNYAFRNYHSDGPGLGLGMNLWFTPFFGVQSKYFSSVSSGVRDGANVVPATTQEFEAGIRFRRHFGYTRKSAQISWGIDYHDSASKISPDATNVVGHKTSGLSLSLEGEVPTTVTHAHIFEVAIRPSQHHSENSTGATARSGAKSETNVISLAIGDQWTLDRRDQIFWKAQYSIERNLYSGSASDVDPKTGTTPTGVSVTNNLLIFYFGFKWGS
ncbi:MAG: hypothetical protein ACXVA9_03310 [Bdellovibrionales bacterium]